MAALFPFLLGFILALIIGIFFGKFIFAGNSKSEIAALSEKINGLNQQLIVQKEQLILDKISSEKQLIHDRSF